MQQSNVKLVSAPLSINDMDEDLESKTVYVFDYEKSSLKGLDFLNYIKNVSVIADIFMPQTTDYLTKSTLLLSYMKSQKFYHITSFNYTILQILYKMKNSDMNTKYSLLTENEIELFIKENNIFLQEFIKIFDSIFAYMMMLATLEKSDFFNISRIKSRYDDKQFITSSYVYPNMMSLLLDDFFYDYYKDGVDINNINYYSSYFDNNLYDNKSFQLILLNDANFVFKTLFDMVHNPKFNNYINQH